MKEKFQPSRLGASVARLFGVTPKAVRDIWRSKTWVDLTSASHTEWVHTDDTGSILQDRPRKRAKNTKEPIPHAQDSILYPAECPTRTENELHDQTNGAESMRPPAPCSRPARFITASHAQIDCIHAFTSPDASIAGITAAPIYQQPPRALSYADVAVLQNDNAQTPTAAPRYAAASGSGSIERVAGSRDRESGGDGATALKQVIFSSPARSPLPSPPGPFLPRPPTLPSAPPLPLEGLAAPLRRRGRVVPCRSSGLRPGGWLGFH